MKCQPSALIGMITWAIAYSYRKEASSVAYWIIFLALWIFDTCACIMNVYNNISWETDVLYEMAPDKVPHGGKWRVHSLGI